MPDPFDNPEEFVRGFEAYLSDPQRQVEDAACRAMMEPIIALARNFSAIRTAMTVGITGGFRTIKAGGDCDCMKLGPGNVR